jgi:hypothetical protein
VPKRRTNGGYIMRKTYQELKKLEKRTPLRMAARHLLLLLSIVVSFFLLFLFTFFVAPITLDWPLLLKVPFFTIAVPLLLAICVAIPALADELGLFIINAWNLKKNLRQGDTNAN